MKTSVPFISLYLLWMATSRQHFTQHLAVGQKGHLKNPTGKGKKRPKPVVPKGFLFDPKPFD